MNRQLQKIETPHVQTTQSKHEQLSEIYSLADKFNLSQRLKQNGDEKTE